MVFNNHRFPCPSQLCGTAAENVVIFQRILDGSETGSRRDIVLLNAAAGLVVSGLADDLGSGVEQALAAISDGRVSAKVEAVQRFGRD